MGRAGDSAGEGPRAGRQQPRNRSVDHIDPGELRQKVGQWLDDHPGGTDEQIVKDLTPGYGTKRLATLSSAPPASTRRVWNRPAPTQPPPAARPRCR